MRTKLSQALGLTETRQDTGWAEIVVLYTGLKCTTAAIQAAADLTSGLNFRLVVIAVHIVPYPLQLRALEAVQQRLGAELQQVVEASSLPVKARIAFARDLPEAFRQSVRPESLVLIGSSKRWWRGRPERWARELARHGFRTALIHV
jgi:hypothetical protein